jgi:hypothetical protein
MGQSAKLEVQIRYCFCCSITVGAILIALWTIVSACAHSHRHAASTQLFYGVLIGLASWGLARPERITDEYYTNCSREAQAHTSRCEAPYSKWHVCARAYIEPCTANADGIVGTRVVVCDASSYHCSLGLYTEELKYQFTTRECPIGTRVLQLQLQNVDPYSYSTSSSTACSSLAPYSC